MDEGKSELTLIGCDGQRVSLDNSESFFFKRDLPKTKGINSIALRLYLNESKTLQPEFIRSSAIFLYGPRSEPSYPA